MNKGHPLLPLQHCLEHTSRRPGCEPCREARNRYERRRRKLQRRVGLKGLVDATGSRRRLEALSRLGYGPTEVGRRLNLHYNNVYRLRRQKWVSVDMANRIDALFRELSMKPSRPTPHQKTIQTKAAQSGYALPLAWDDIDNDEAPQDVELKQRNHIEDGKARMEDYLFLRSQGLSEPLIAERLGIKLQTLGALRRRYEKRAA